MEINIENYLSENEIKEICRDEVINLIRSKFSNEKETERILSNLSYAIVFNEIEKNMPNYKDFLIKKTESILKCNSSLKYLIYNNHYLTNEPISFASKLVENTVKENQQLIKDMVIESIINHDFSDEISVSLTKTAEELVSNIYDLSNLLTKKHTQL
jgi:hypothetical protein